MRHEQRFRRRDEQNANAYPGFGDLRGNDEAAARVRAAWLAVLPPFDGPDGPCYPEFNTTGRCDG